MPGAFPGGSASGSGSASAAPRGAERESLSTRFEVDQTLPTTSVQIRLADGTRYLVLLLFGFPWKPDISIRMVCRMNLTHTVQDLRNFINA